MRLTRDDAWKCDGVGELKINAKGLVELEVELVPGLEEESKLPGNRMLRSR